MGKFIKILLGITILIGLLLGVVVLGAVMYFDPNDYKDRIIANVEEETGRQLKLEGDIKLSYYPWLGIELSGVTLGNAKGFGKAPFMHADAVALRIKTLPLLKKQYELDTLRLHGVEVNLAKNKEGVSNWDDLVAEEKDDSPKREPVKLAAVILGGVDIKDTRFTWVDQVSNQSFKISDLNVSIGELTFGEPIDIKMNMKAESTNPAVKTDLKMQGTATYDLDAETYTFKPIEVTANLTGKNVPGGKARLKFNTGIAFNLKDDAASINDLTLSVLGTLVKLQLNASNIKSGKPITEGQLSVVGEDLSRLFKIIGEDKLAAQLASLKDSSFDLQASLNADMKKGNVAISDLKAKLIGAVIMGQVEASNIESDTPSLKGKLKASGSDLPTLLQVAGQFEGGKDPKLKDYGKKLSRASNKSFKVDVEFEADLASGKINVPILSARSLGLSLEGRLQADNINSKKGNIDGQLSLNGEKLSAVLAAVDQGALGGVLKKISMDVGIKGSSSDINFSPLNLKAIFASKDIPNSSVDLTLVANTKMNLDKQTLSVNNLQLNGLGLDLKANVNATQIKDKPEFTGDLAVTEFNLRKFMKQMKQEVPVTADPKVLRKVAVKTKFSGSGSSLDLKDFSLLLDDTNLRGKLSVKHFTQPSINFGIDIDSINADRYLPPPAKGKAGKTAQQATPETELPLETLRKLNSKGELNIGKLVFSNTHSSNLKLGLDARDGLIKLDPITADLYQGKYKGTIMLDVKGKLAELKQDTQLSGVQIEPLLKDYTRSKESQLAGVANISTKISSRGADAVQLKHALNGQVKLAVTEGILRGIDVRKTLEQAEVLLESKRLGTVKQGGETKFEQLSATLNIKQGVVKNNDLLMTAPGFKVNGGINKRDLLVNLHNNSIKYDLSVAVVEESTARGEENYNIGGYQIPIRCRGSLEDIASACKPDYGKLLEGAVKKSLLDKLGIGRKKKSTTDSGSKTTSTQQQETTQQPKSEPRKAEDLLKESLKDLLPF